ncbi:hypothetical protein LOZ39_002041 [Ophidiomyces ophidiicola]|nr:hypothetical protein LOZ61_004015 [Ophidiomyces ophidiicola]KAI1918825.1 hypothetical protein LOZ64_002586 [Ophidiomyces ophidiicola]KAI1923871.1 hypothetical protein LOZ60_005014 [Ophidiomyces ophidiicola]KAI1963770.1 hypothetical protein LOZ59_001695 [Ophidiomyces ophidiicola]KAI2015029.1 hypothetical protein LOZ49_000949 [Ophidiomyces ophidiicola]
MNIPSFRLSRPFLFSLLTVSVLASKLLHLFLHAHTIPVLRFIIYFPTFFIQDAAAIIFCRFLLHGGGGIFSVIGLMFGGFLAFLVLGAAASQFGFFYVTSAEMQFDSAATVVSDPAAVRLLLSGLTEVLISGLLLIIISFFCTPWMYNKVGFWLASIGKLRTPGNWDMLLPTVRSDVEEPQRRVVRIWPFCLLTGILALITLLCMRPTVPYRHISVTLPVALLRVFKHHTAHESHHECGNGSELYAEPFPFPDLISEDKWEMPHDNFKGWAPGTRNSFVNKYSQSSPSWLLKNMPYAFKRWIPHNDTQSTKPGDSESTAQCAHETNDGPNYYNPVADPFRITNLDSPMYESLQAALSSVLISNVVLITMESQRKDVFPMKEGSNLHKNILKSHWKKDSEEINEKLRQLTPVAEQLTGESFWKDPTGKSNLNLTSNIWRDEIGSDMGGINVVGALSTCSLSLKSFLGSHCGVFPLPVDFLQESTRDIYQPCIPHILDLFNTAKLEGKKGTKDLDPRSKKDSYRKNVLSRPWKTVYVQAVTETFDRQNIMNRKMGLSNVITKETLDDRHSKYYPSNFSEVNYFGYPDQAVERPLRDQIKEAAEGKSRLFLSHFTTTSHHPWHVPDDFNKTEYFVSRTKQDLNNYLNAIHYDDAWMGNVLKMLEEGGIANETLVVFIGDHGHTFEEEGSMTVTYKNSHVTNFRVPIVFRHPQLPRITVNANATSLSIIPTLLDLLINSNSLNDFDTTVASDIIHDYEGQSLLRPYKTEHKGRKAWDFSVVNAGADMVAVQLAGKPWRLVVPLKPDFAYRFTRVDTDPNEDHPIEEWSMPDLSATLKSRWGEEPAEWAVAAEKATHWWRKEMHRLWNYPTYD